MPIVNQHDLLVKIRDWQKFHRLYPRVAEHGHCHGLTLWWMHCAILGQEQQFFDRLMRIKAKSLFEVSIDDDFNTVCNNITWLQNHRSYDHHSAQTNPLSLLSTLFATEDSAYPISNPVDETISITLKQLTELIGQLRQHRLTLKLAQYSESPISHCIGLKMTELGVTLYDSNATDLILFSAEDGDELIARTILERTKREYFPAKHTLNIQQFCLTEETNAVPLAKMLQPYIGTQRTDAIQQLKHACTTGDIALLDKLKKDPKLSMTFKTSLPLDYALLAANAAATAYLIEEHILPKDTARYLAGFVQSGRIDVIKILLPYLRLAHLYHDHEHALTLAIHCRQSQIAAILIEHFSHLEITSEMIELALRYELRACIKAMCEHRPTLLNEACIQDMTMLNFAISKKTPLKLIREIIELKGIDNLSYDELYELYYYAVQLNDINMVTTLIERFPFYLKSEYEDIVTAMDLGYRELALSLIHSKKGGFQKSVCCRGVREENLATVTFQNGYYDFFETLLDASESLVQRFLQSPVAHMYVVDFFIYHRQSYKILSFLLNHELIDKNMRSVNNDNLLHLALRHHHQEETLLKLIAINPAFIHERNQDGKTPLELAIETDNATAVEILLQHQQQLPFSLSLPKSLFETALESDTLRPVIRPYLVWHIDHLIEKLLEYPWQNRAYFLFNSDLVPVRYQGQDYPVRNTIAPIVKGLINLKETLPMQHQAITRLISNVYQGYIKQLREKVAEIPNDLLGLINAPQLADRQPAPLMRAPAQV